MRFRIIEYNDRGRYYRVEKRNGFFGVWETYDTTLYETIDDAEKAVHYFYNWEQEKKRKKTKQVVKTFVSTKDKLKLLP